MITVCDGWGGQTHPRKVQKPDGTWGVPPACFKPNAPLTHGMCPECTAAMDAQLDSLFSPKEQS